MAQKVMVELLDDLDGTKAEATVRFGLDSTEYEIDLNAKNQDKLRKALAPFVAGARKVRSTKHGRPAHVVRVGPDTKAVRVWAASQTPAIEVPQRGRIPQAVIDQYVAAGN